jgi:tetratricopeptide (TPR) repeat protein
MVTDFPSDGYSRQAIAPGGGGARPGGGRPGAQRANQAPGGVFGILHVVSGNDRGKQHQLINLETTIGRGADQDFILADIAVSRRHVIIYLEGNRYRVKDLGSGNGTLINGVRTDSVILNDGDQIEIGNTVMRLEHAPSRQQSVAMAAQPLHAAPDNKTMLAGDVMLPPGVGAPMGVPQQAPPPAYAPQPPPAYGQPQQPAYQQPPQQAYPQQPAYGQPQQPQHTMNMNQGFMPPMEPIATPSQQRPQPSSLPPVINTGTHRSPGLLDSTAKKVAVFGALALIVLLGGALVVKKFVLGGNDAQKLYADGTKAFNEGDYPKAKDLFKAALEADPELPQAGKFVKQCDAELRALGQLKTANSLMAKKRWGDAVKALKSLDKSTRAYRESEDTRKEATTNAVDDYLAKAKDFVKDNANDDAQTQIDAALELDPENAEALELQKQLKGGGGSTPTKVAAAEEPKAKEPPPAPAHGKHEKAPKEVKVAKGGKAPKGGGGGDDDLAPVKGGAAPAAGGPVDLLTSKAAGPYRSRDFAGAAAALKGQKGAESLVGQLNQLAGVYGKAEGDKTKNVQAAVSEYQGVLALDQKLSKGIHAAYVKGQLSSLARNAFAQQKFDVAFDAAKYAGDEGVKGQLKAKAAELNSKAEAMKKSNPAGAKALWRTVVRIVPPGDPNFVKATQNLSASTGGAAAHTDEDE